MIRKRTYGYDRYKLYQNLSVEELVSLKRSLEDDPANRNPKPNPWIFNAKTRRRLDNIAYAITYHLKDRREATV